MADELKVCLKDDVTNSCFIKSINDLIEKTCTKKGLKELKYVKISYAGKWQLFKINKSTKAKELSGEMYRIEYIGGNALPQNDSIIILTDKRLFICQACDASKNYLCYAKTSKTPSFNATLIAD